ncbi:hypothetical protein [Nocardia sp. NPDC052112]|uniref:hypothetical protein n=1 Tax=Nocardia sp. NPDC052112 TaxID=3155646 RepID=UPI0034460DD4
MTQPARPIATTPALDILYVIANTATGAQFVIYAPGSHDERGMYTVAHVSGSVDGLAAPRIHLVHPDDIAAYAAGVVNRMRDSECGHAVQVWLDRTTGPLRTRLS